MTCSHLMQPTIFIFSTTFQTEAYGRLIQLSLAWSLFPNGWLVTSYNNNYNYNYNYNNNSLCRQIKCRKGNCFLKNRQGEEKGGKALRAFVISWIILSLDTKIGFSMFRLVSHLSCFRWLNWPRWSENVDVWTYEVKPVLINRDRNCYGTK